MNSAVKGRTRLTRTESKEQTRRRLVDAAAEVFAERGFHGASVEEIAERAGYTRGAFYSNFSGKDDVFLAAYDAYTTTQVGEVGTLFRTSPTPADFFASLRTRRDEAPASISWMLLQDEFMLYAMRNPEVRPRFAERLRRIRRHYAQAIEDVYASLGLDLPAPVDDLALILQMIDEGTFPLRHLDPDAVRPGFFFDALTLLFEAGVALSRQRAGAS